MSNEDVWRAMSKGKEGSYFLKKEEEALQRLAEKSSHQRLSPVTGEKMVQEVYAGVVIDRCPTSGGIWLDAHELEHIIERVTHAENKEVSPSSLLARLLRGGPKK